MLGVWTQRRAMNSGRSLPMGVFFHGWFGRGVVVAGRRGATAISLRPCSSGARRGFCTVVRGKDTVRHSTSQGWSKCSTTVTAAPRRAAPPLAGGWICKRVEWNWQVRLGESLRG